VLHSARLTAKKIAERLKLIEPLVYRRRAELPLFHYRELSGPGEPPPLDLPLDAPGWQVIQNGSVWGRWRVNFHMRSSFTVPADWDTDAPIALHLPIGQARDFSHPEAMIYIDGKSYAATDRHHQEIYLRDAHRGGKTFTLDLHGFTGLTSDSDEKNPTRLLVMRPSAVVQIDEPTRELVSATRVALGTSLLLDDNDVAKNGLLNALDAGYKLLDLREPFGDGFYASVPAALEALKDGLAVAGQPLEVDVIGVGHAHIDVAWLWTLAQTRHKAARTFSTVLRLMEEYPDYHFTQSQPQLYQYVEQDHPEIFAQIKERIAEGRWETIGGAWVEPDCNASGAEALARQFLLGRNYFRRHFGEGETPVFWLPDTFGYPWALPQIIKEAGLNYFITHKISWNVYNRLPYQSFWWQGLDGTRVLTHFMTTTPHRYDDNLPYSTTYNAEMTPSEVLGTWRNYTQKEHHDELMIVYGYGDGGGGPTREMIEDAHQFAQLSGAPQVRLGRVSEFLENLETVSDTLPTWNGELYLEYHRGTFTSQARTKRNNRKAEYALHDAEFLATAAALLGELDYPRETLNQAWELVCLNQFHDILPGSSIGPVYEDSARDFEIIFRLAADVRAQALEVLARHTPAGASWLVANPTSFGGRKLALLPDGVSGVAVHGADAALLTQAVDGGTLVEIPAIAPYGMLALGSASSPATDDGTGPTATAQDGGVVLENALITVEIAASGDITRIYDKAAQRDVLENGQRGNVFQAFEDRPLNYDAWDIDLFFEDKQWEAEPAYSLEITENGPIRASIVVKRRLFHSEIHQRISLYRDSKQVDFETWVDWHEHHILLKVAFPVDVLNARATYDVQWGNIERPTHRNTSWDWARFEVPAHKWADLSEGHYGVSLMNDCKYGYDIHGNVMRLSLLKGATSPDPNADQGKHTFIYSLLPHTGDWSTTTIEAGYALNDPLIVAPAAPSGDAQPLASLVSTDADSVIIETVKWAEDGNGLIVRLYENERARGSASLTTSFPLSAAYRTNILEEDDGALEVDGNTARFSYRPYEIISLRLIPA
jgi:alpha-mannosidase